MSEQPVGSVVRQMGVKIKPASGQDVDYAPAVTAVNANESHDTVTMHVAIPDGAVTDVGPSSWVLNVAYNVDWNPGSLHRILEQHQGEQAQVTWTPDPVGAPDVTQTATVVLVPGGAQQTVGQARTATVDLPCKGKPVTVDAAP